MRGGLHTVVAALALALALAGCGGEPGGALGALAVDDVSLAESAIDTAVDADGSDAVEGETSTQPAAGSGSSGVERPRIALDFVVPVFPGLDTYSKRCDPFDDGADVCM